MEEAEKLQDFIDRFGASATKATQAKDREKKLAKLKVLLHSSTEQGFTSRHLCRNKACVSADL